jgi:hypothetical protein
MKVSLKKVVEQLELAADMMTSFFEKKTGRLFSVTDELMEEAEKIENLENEKIYEWKKEILEDAKATLERPEDFLVLPSKYEIHDYEIMRNFCETLEDDREDFLSAIRSKGAFRRFKNMLFQRGKMQEWNVFYHKALVEIAKDWCEGNEISFEREFELDGKRFRFDP